MTSERMSDGERILETFGTWAVTEYGIESEDGCYAIPFDRLDEPDWFRHVTQKSWCNNHDFAQAFGFANNIWRLLQNKRRLKHYLCLRDGFKCAICSRDLIMPQMQIDHIVPKARGGRDILSNLRIACADCNWSKMADVPETTTLIASLARR